MNTPDYSDEVAGVDDLTAADLDALGVEAQPRSYTRWKPIAEAAEKEAIFWRTALIYLAVLWILTTAALVVAVTVT
jgi:hypothetical protein